MLVGVTISNPRYQRFAHPASFGLTSIVMRPHRRTTQDHEAPTVGDLSPEKPKELNGLVLAGEKGLAAARALTGLLTVLLIGWLAIR